MLFAAGVGIDMLFYSVTGPISQYIAPPAGDPQSAEAARDVIDIVTLVGTVFGVATSMGIGVVLLNVGFSLLFGLRGGLALQISLVAVAVVMTVAACTSGMDKGIRVMSELNLWSAGAMMLYILITGNASFLLNAMVENIGRFIFTLPERTLQTFAYEPGGSDRMAGWSLFFWAFWLAWGPFVGLFLARISRGRCWKEIRNSPSLPWTVPNTGGMRCWRRSLGPLPDWPGHPVRHAVLPDQRQLGCHGDFKLFLIHSGPRR